MELTCKKFFTQLNISTKSNKVHSMICGRTPRLYRTINTMPILFNHVKHNIDVFLTNNPFWLTVTRFITGGRTNTTTNFFNSIVIFSLHYQKLTEQFF